MSELSQTIKKAILVFTHAGDFVVPLYEDAYLIAEDISDEMAAEQTLYQQDFEARQLIENEIEGAVAFFAKLPAAFLVIQISLFEDCLLEICDVAAQASNIPFRSETTGRFTVEKASEFIENELKVKLPDLWPTHEKVKEFQRLRDHVVRQGSLDDQSVNISDTFLVEINETIVLFFQELQSHLLQNPDGG